MDRLRHLSHLSHLSADKRVNDSAVVEEVAREHARLQQAERVVGHSFSSAGKARLLTALTHKSYLNEAKTTVTDNEVLEFVGDAVLSLVVVDALVGAARAAGVDVDEGSLTERRAAHVSAEHLAEKSFASGLASLLRTSRGFVAGGLPKNVAADAVEAVIGAVYEDAGLDAARAVVLRLLGPPPERVTVSGAHAKRALQERLQGLFGRAPEYVVSRGDGPNHAPSFDAAVLFCGVELGRGVGKNKRDASEAAAAAALAALSTESDAALRARLSSSLPSSSASSSSKQASSSKKASKKASP